MAENKKRAPKNLYVPKKPTFQRCNYPDVFESNVGYLVTFADENLYWGYSKHVARLLVNCMKAQCY